MPAPALFNKSKPTLVLGLDETVVHGAGKLVKGGMIRMALLCHEASRS